MRNLHIYLPLADGGELPLAYPTGRELIKGMVSDDIASPPRALCIEATTDDGKRVTITIPYTDIDAAIVAVS